MRKRKAPKTQQVEHCQYPKKTSDFSDVPSRGPTLAPAKPLFI